VRKLLRSPVVKVVARWANKEPFIWDGVYANFGDVPAVGQGFASEAWLSDMERYTQAAVSAVRDNEFGIPENVPQYHALLALLVASISALDRPVRVLDVGGGMGIGAANVRRCISEKIRLDYRIVDNQQSCERGRRLLRDLPWVTFIPELPREVGTVDVVVLSSVLQFFEDYETQLKRLAAFKPSYWLFAFLPAGEIPTFASAQLNVPGSVLPVWFFNVNELVAKIEALGYRLSFKSALDRVFDMSNFPLTHRLSRQCNLLFRRQCPG
jgi:putative methyltransferase (TIGR04325 family)